MDSTNNPQQNLNNGARTNRNPMSAISSSFMDQRIEIHPSPTVRASTSRGNIRRNLSLQDLSLNNNLDQALSSIAAQASCSRNPMSEISSSFRDQRIEIHPSPTVCASTSRDNIRRNLSLQDLSLNNNLDQASSPIVAQDLSSRNPMSAISSSIRDQRIEIHSSPTVRASTSRYNIRRNLSPQDLSLNNNSDQASSSSAAQASSSSAAQALASGNSATPSYQNIGSLDAVRALRNRIPFNRAERFRAFQEIMENILNETQAQIANANLQLTIQAQEVAIDHFNIASNLLYKPLSPSDINKIPVILISEEHTNAQLNCTICLENFTQNQQAKQLPCGHIFHIHCIERWLIVNCTCPLCRNEIDPDRLI